MGFEIVIMDEAYQSTEPASLVACLTGEIYQFAPTTAIDCPMDADLSKPLMKRMLAAGVPSIMLEVQHLMQCKGTSVSIGSVGDTHNHTNGL